MFYPIRLVCGPPMEMALRMVLCGRLQRHEVYRLIVGELNGEVDTLAQPNGD